MILRALRIANFGCIDEYGYDLEIDRIVVLIGPNNVGKSSILDAYEAFASVGSALPIHNFRDGNPANAVSISGTFCGLTPDDLETVGAKWKHQDPRYGDCIKVKWEWTTPEEKGKKFSWDPEKNGWVEGGMHGWDTLIASRIPLPLRVRPTDDASTTEAQFVDILTSAAKAAVKADAGRTAEVVQALRKLTQELASELESQLSEATRRISERLGLVFPGYGVEFEPEIGKFEPEKAVGSGSYIRIKGPSGAAFSLAQEGAGLRRTFLWSALGTLADIGRAKHGKTPILADRQRILLIEEPESFLHPPMVRAACQALYSLAETPEWQVIATTHSPAFIDVAKPHTTIVRLARDGEQRTRLFSTDRASFTDEERENLRMVRSCHPTVAEFFFADQVILVEGETEHAVLGFLLFRDPGRSGEQALVVNCLGKANLPLFQRILNQFGSPYTVFHDSDAPRVQRGGNWQRNAMWTINERILDTLGKRAPDLPPSKAVANIPDFECRYFGRRISSDKPFQALQILLQPGFDSNPAFEPLRSLVPLLLDGTHPGTYGSIEELASRVGDWAKGASPEEPAQWEFE